MGKGKTYELKIKNEINEHTRGCVKAHRPDFSGNSTGEVADIMVVWQADRVDHRSTGASSDSSERDRYGDQSPCGHPERHVAYIELKKRQAGDGKRCIVMQGSSKGQSGLGELTELVRDSPYWADCYLAVKFNNREIIVLDARELLRFLEGDSSYPEAERHGARLTPSDNLSMVKPTLDSWDSSRAGQADYHKLLNEIGVEDYYVTES